VTVTLKRGPGNAVKKGLAPKKYKDGENRGRLLRDALNPNVCSKGQERGDGSEPTQTRGTKVRRRWQNQGGVKRGT